MSTTITNPRPEMSSKQADANCRLYGAATQRKNRGTLTADAALKVLAAFRAEDGSASVWQGRRAELVQVAARFCNESSGDRLDKAILNYLEQFPENFWVPAAGELSAEDATKLADAKGAIERCDTKMARLEEQLAELRAEKAAAAAVVANLTRS